MTLERTEKEIAMKRVILTVSVLSVMFFGANIVQAGQPIMFTDSGSGQVFVGDCPDFEVWEDAAWEVAGKAYFNKDGELIRIKWHYTLEGGVFNLDAPENFLPYKNSVYTERFDVETGEDRVMGLWALVTVPGYGAIFMDMGLIILVGGDIVFEAGKHQWFNANVDELCEHLAE